MGVEGSPPGASGVTSAADAQQQEKRQQVENKKEQQNQPQEQDPKEQSTTTRQDADVDVDNGDLDADMEDVDAASSDPLLLVEEQQLHGIKEPHSNDVLCGRGVTTNRFPGNCSFRALVGVNKVRKKAVVCTWCLPHFASSSAWNNKCRTVAMSHFP